MFWEHQGEAPVTWMDSELKCRPRKQGAGVFSEGDA